MNITSVLYWYNEVETPLFYLRPSSCQQPQNAMTTMNQKHLIIESLNSLDQRQTEKVMDYIKRLTNSSVDAASYQKFKLKALEEIRQALQQ